MAHRTLRDLFDNARTYLDTDEQNFPDDLCNIMLQRVYFQAVTQDREWRFFQLYGTQDVTAGSPTASFAFNVVDPTDQSVSTFNAIRIYTLTWNMGLLDQREYTKALAEHADETVGTPVAYAELNRLPDRQIRLFPTPVSDGTLGCDFYADVPYPASAGGGGPYDVTFFPLPEEWDAALLEGLLAELYMREEDLDLFSQHRQAFLEQTGAIRNRWRYSQQTPVVMAGRARIPGRDPGGFDSMGRLTQPTAW